MNDKEREEYWERMQSVKSNKLAGPEGEEHPKEKVTDRDAEPDNLGAPPSNRLKKDRY